MKIFSLCALVLCLVHAGQSRAEAPCKIGDLPARGLTGDTSTVFGETHAISKLEQQFLLARPVYEGEIKQARRSVRGSNCFLRAVLRPQVTEAIKRGALTYLSLSRSERISGEGTKLYGLLSEAVNKAVGSVRSGDVFLSLLVFVESSYRFRGATPGSISRLENEGHRQGIYSRHDLPLWVLVNYASSLTGSESLRAEESKRFQIRSQSTAPPVGYVAKGCKGRIRYSWPTISTPKDSYDDLRKAPGSYLIGDYDVHWGVCPDDDSIWVYHYQFGWKKASMNEAVEVCRDEGGRRPLASACKGMRE